MKRIGSQLIFCAPDVVLRNNIVELNNDNKVLNLIDLSVRHTETYGTLFYDGIISAGIYSLKKRNINFNSSELTNNYLYIDLTKLDKNIELSVSSKKLILDAGTDDPTLFSKALNDCYNFLKSTSIFDIIAGATFYPAEFAGESNEISTNGSTKAILWQNCDLILKQITASTTIRTL
jgi:hypothetical protein